MSGWWSQFCQEQRVLGWSRVQTSQAGFQNVVRFDIMFYGPTLYNLRLILYCRFFLKWPAFPHKHMLVVSLHKEKATDQHIWAGFVCAKQLAGVYSGDAFGTGAVTRVAVLSHSYKVSNCRYCAFQRRARFTQTHSCCPYIHRQNVEKQFAYAQTPFSRSHYAHSHSQTGAADTSYLTSLPSSDMKPTQSFTKKILGNKKNTNTETIPSRFLSL